MFCPVCGAAELVHGVHAIAYTYKGRTTSFQLEGDKCPACDETVLAKPGMRQAGRADGSL